MIARQHQEKLQKKRSKTGKKKTENEIVAKAIENKKN